MPNFPEEEWDSSDLQHSLILHASALAVKSACGRGSKDAAAANFRERRLLCAWTNSSALDARFSLG